MDVSNIQGATIMAKTEEEKKIANREAVKTFYREKCMEFKVRPRKEDGQAIKDYAQAIDMSVQKLFLDAVREYMARHSENDNALEVVESTNGCTVEISQEVYEKARLSANYRKCSVNEFVELAITEQRKREICEFSISIKEKQQ